MSDLLFSVSGLRGVVGRSLTPEVVLRHAAAFARLVGPGPIVIGRDTRPSGGMVAAAAAAAATGLGCDVLDVGIVPTPTIQLTVEHARAAGGLCVTASHNPLEWNALKFVGPDGQFLDAERIARMKALVAALSDGAADAPWVDAKRVGRVAPYPGAVEAHIAAILALPHVDAAAVRAWAPRVVLDCVNGAGAALTPLLLETLGCDVDLLYCDLSGVFPRGAEPVPENLGALGARVRETGAALGFAHDPDADRLAIVGPDGVPLGEETTLVLAVDAVLARTPGPVVTNLSTTRAVEDVAARYGAAVSRTPVGEANVVQGMRAAGAVIGGEGNGGVIDPALHYGRDAPLAAALILTHLAREGRSLAKVLETMPRYTMRKLKMPVAGAGAFDAEGVAAALTALEPGRLDRADGVRLDVADGWVHVRASGTEPVVRIIAEAEDRAAVDRLVGAAERALAGLATAR